MIDKNLADLNDEDKESQFCATIIDITPSQRRLIEDMNEFCREKFDFNGKNCKDASEYIDRNIEEFKLNTMSNWQYQYM